MPISPPAYGGHFTRDELVDEVNKNLGGRGTDEDPSNTRILRHLDLAVQRFAREADWVDLRRETSITTTYTGNVNNDAFVDLYAKIYAAASVDLRLVYSLRILENVSTDHKIQQIMPRQWDLMFPDSRAYSVAGSFQEVTHYVIWNKFTVQLYRVPNAAVPIRVRYAIWPTPVSSLGANDAIEFENKDEVIIALATHSLMQSLRMRDDAKQFFAIYVDLLERAKRDNDRQPDASRLPQGTTEVQSAFPREYWLDPFYEGE